MVSIFSKRARSAGLRSNTQDYSFLGADIHSHLIPGIDDGSPDPDTSLALIRELQSLGFRRIVTTPHIMQDYYPNTAAIIQEGLQRLREYLVQHGVDIRIDAAAEYLMDEHFEELLERKELLTIDGSSVLTEFSFIAPPLKLQELLFRLRVKGYTPILAHPERYSYFHSQPDQFRRLKETGCLLQMNINSLYGYYGKSVKKAAWKLLEEGWIDYLATDLHHHNHLHALSKGLHTREWEMLAKYPFKNQSLLSVPAH